MKVLVYIDDNGIPCIDEQAVIQHFLPEVKRAIRECGLKPKADDFYPPQEAEAWRLFQSTLRNGDFEDRPLPMYAAECACTVCSELRDQ